MSNSGVLVPEDGPTGPVPYIQSSDLNDGDILNQTRKFAGPNGTIVLRYVDSAGETVAESEPIQADLIGKAMLGWVDQVKALLVEKAAQAADAAIRAQRQAQLDGPGIPRVDAESPEAAAIARTIGRQAPPPDPDAMRRKIEAQQGAFGGSPRILAKLKVGELRQRVATLEKQLAEAATELEEWEAVANALKTEKRPKRRGRKTR